MASTTTPPKNRSVDNVRKHGTGWQARTCVDGVKLSKTFPTKNEAKLWLTLKRGEVPAQPGRAGHPAIPVNQSAPASPGLTSRVGVKRLRGTNPAIAIHY